jgi:hypothetical protein
MSTMVTTLGGSELTDTEIQTVSGSPEPPKYRRPMMSTVVLSSPENRDVLLAMEISYQLNCKNEISTKSAGSKGRKARYLY